MRLIKAIGMTDTTVGAWAGVLSINSHG
jgi:hypothetical protein